MTSPSGAGSAWTLAAVGDIMLERARARHILERLRALCTVLGATMPISDDTGTIDIA